MRALRSSALFFFLAFFLSWYPYLLGKTHLVRTSGGINPLGPAVAALIVAGIFYRWRGIKELLARYLPWRAHWTNYAIAFALPVLLSLDNLAYGVGAGPLTSSVAGHSAAMGLTSFAMAILGFLLCGAIRWPNVRIKQSFTGCALVVVGIGLLFT